MQDLNDKISGDTLSASEWNQVPSEIQNIIEEAGITLSGADLAQLVKAIKILSSENNFYTVGGTADAVTLTSASTSPHTAYFTGMTVNFIKTNQNTIQGVTVDVDGLGSKDVREYDASFVSIGEFFGLITLIYDGAKFVVERNNKPIGSNVFYQSIDAAGTGTVDLIKADASNQTVVGDAANNLLAFFDDMFLGGADEPNSRISIVNDRIEIKNSSGTVQIRSFTGATTPVLIRHNGSASLEEAGFAYMISSTFAANKLVDDTDSSSYFEYTGTGGHTFTVTDTTAIGTYVIANNGTGNLTIVEDTSATLEWLDGGGLAPPTGNRTLARAGVATIHVRATNEHRIWGVGLS